MAELTMTDTFKGDDQALMASIRALVSLDESGSLSHPLGGHARTLLEAACVRLAASQALIAENERLREEHDKAWRRAGVAEENVKAAEQYIVRYSWLRKQVERRNPELFVVSQNIGHDWIQVYDLDRAIDDAIEKEVP